MDALRLHAYLLTHFAIIARELDRIALARMAEQREKIMPQSKLDTAATEYEKLIEGHDFHGEGLLRRMAESAARLDAVTKKAHARLDARDAAITAMDHSIDRFDKLLGGNNPPVEKDPTTSSSAASPSGSNGSGASSEASVSQEQHEAEPARREPADSWVNGRRAAGA